VNWIADNFTPMWIVYFCVLAVVGVVVGVFIHHHKPGQTMRQTIGASPFTLLGAFLFSTSILSLMGFSSPTVVDWWQALAIRVAWHMGGIIILEIGIVLDARYGGSLSDRPVWILMAVFFTIGAWLSLNSARDLISGPVVLRGNAAIQIEKAHRIRGGDAIWANVDLKAADGTNVTIDMRGWGAEQAESLYESCDPNGDVLVTVLLHTERVLDVACK
jgi:hypothetical protein